MHILLAIPSRRRDINDATVISFLVLMGRWWMTEEIGLVNEAAYLDWCWSRLFLCSARWSMVVGAWWLVECSTQEPETPSIKIYTEVSRVVSHVLNLSVQTTTADLRSLFRIPKELLWFRFGNEGHNVAWRHNACTSTILRSSVDLIIIFTIQIQASSEPHKMCIVTSKPSPSSVSTNYITITSNGDDTASSPVRIMRVLTQQGLDQSSDSSSQERREGGAHKRRTKYRVSAESHPSLIFQDLYFPGVWMMQMWTEIENRRIAQEGCTKGYCTINLDAERCIG